MATELGKAYVQIVPSARGISGKINQAIGGEAKSAGVSAGRSLGGELVSVASKVIATVGIGKALGASLTAGGALQQSLGGVETLFKGHAQNVVRNAQNAYRTAGISANDYMENVTSFSASLLQSLGGNTQKAAQVADMAMTDMADNMNKMGTPLQNIQDAYQGFAKQNYTMLDNLKLGYGGTKTEMERLLADAQELSGVEYDIDNLADVYEAIHVIQENLGITGTTAKEAESTLTGSFMAMKASAENVMGSLALGDNLKPALVSLADTTATFFFGNFIPMLTEIISNIPVAVGTLLSAGAPHVFKAGKQMMDQMGVGFTSAMDGILPKLQSAIQPIINGFKTSFGQLPTMFSAIASAIMPIIETIILAFSRLDFSGIQSIIEAVIPAITNAFTTFMSIAAPAIDMVVNSFVNLWNAIQPVLSLLAEALMPVLEIVASFAGGVVKGALMGLAGAFDLIRIAVEILTPIINILVQVFKFISPVLSTIAEWVGVVIGLFGGLGSSGNSLKDILKNAWENIKNVIGTVKDFIGGAINGIKGFFSGMGSAGDALKSAIQTAWNAIKGAINTAKNAINTAINGIKGFFSGLLNSGNSLRNALSNAWSAIQGAVSNAGSKITGVVNGIKGTFNSLKNIDLFGAGKAILESFYNGLKSVWGKITGFVGGIGSWIKEHKGPIEYDRKLLIPAGKAIMQGLDQGLIDNFKSVQSTVSGMGQKIASEMNASVSDLNNELSFIDGQFSHSVSSDFVGYQDSVDELFRRLIPYLNPEVVVQVDGRTIARTTREYTDQELASMYALKERGR